MTSTIGVPAAPEACVVRPPGRSPVRSVSGPRSQQVIVRRLPRQQPVSEPPEPEPAEETAGRPIAAGMAVAAIEVRTVLQLTMETLDGRRPRSQLGGRLSKEVLRYLAAANGRLNPAPDRRVRPATRRHSPPGLHSVHLCHPAEGITEASAVWRHRGRFRALAARFEWSGTRWVCTTLRLG